MLLELADHRRSISDWVYLWPNCLCSKDVAKQLTTFVAPDGKDISFGILWSPRTNSVLTKKSYHGFE